MKWCAAFALLAITPAFAASTAEREAEVEAKLEALRVEIAALSAQHAEATSHHDDGVAALRAIDTEISTTARRLRDLQAGIEQQNAALAVREAERVVLNETLGKSRTTLATLLRSVYVVGRGESLKALLARDRISDTGRALAYYRYLQRDRLRRVQQLISELAKLVEVEQAIAKARERLALEHTRAETEASQLGVERVRREGVLGDIDAQLKEGETRLAALGRDEQDLLRLLEELRDIFADIPKQLDAAQPFSALRGRLTRPHAAKVRTGFGASIGTGRASEGWLLASASGESVHAVAHGRVAFADWLKGFGLLLIVDHGDGYMSLYAQNEALLKDVGDWVSAGDAIATTGSSGGAAQPGLYFELRHQGKPLDPKPWFAP